MCRHCWFWVTSLLISYFLSQFLYILNFELTRYWHYLRHLIAYSTHSKICISSCMQSAIPILILLDLNRWTKIDYLIFISFSKIWFWFICAVLKFRSLFSVIWELEERHFDCIWSWWWNTLGDSRTCSITIFILRLWGGLGLYVKSFHKTADLTLIEKSFSTSFSKTIFLV